MVAPAPPTAAAATPPAPIVFVLTPILATTSIVDMNTSEGRKLYSAATKCLFADTDSLYDGKAEGLASFLHQLGVGAQEYGCAENGILDNDIAVRALFPHRVNLLEHYGELLVDQV